MEKINSVVFFDMDGTLLSSQSTILPEVSEAMKQLKANGNIPVVCTGRAAFEVRAAMKECQIDSIVSMNGQYIEFEGQTILNKTIPAALCDKVLQYAKSREDLLGFYNYQQIAVSDDNQLSRDFYKHIHSSFPLVDAAFYESNPVNQLLVISKQTDTSYAQKFPELEFLITGEKSIDTVLKGSSKGIGVKHLLQKRELNVPTYAFGDGNNDLPMFEAVDHRIAMENGNAAIKNAADFVTDTNDNLGIVSGLKTLQLI